MLRLRYVTKSPYLAGVKHWMPSVVSGESELTSSFSLMLQIY